MPRDVLESVREASLSIYNRLDYQKVGDSPTVKYYTKWSLFDEYLDKPGIANGIGLRVKADFEKVGLSLYSSVDESELFSRLIKPNESRVVAAHYSSLKDALTVSVRESAEVVIETGDLLGGSSIHPRHLILIVDNGVEADIYIHAGGFNEDALETLFIESFIGSRSKVNILNIVEPPKTRPSLFIIRHLLGDYSSVKYMYISRGGLMHHENELALLGEGSEYYSGAAFTSRQGYRLDYVSTVIHEGGRSRSHIRSHGVAFDGGYVVARGLAKITRGGEWSSTIFEAGVALIGDESIGYSSPMLEIDTGRVIEARHEAREYRYGDDQLFYLESRGLSRGEAEYLLTYGILIDQARHMDERLHERIDKYIKMII